MNLYDYLTGIFLGIAIGYSLRKIDEKFMIYSLSLVIAIIVWILRK
jgi:hypothetical protein